MASGRSPRQFAILRRADDLRDDLLASGPLLPEHEVEVEFTVAGLSLQKGFEEAL